MTTKTTQSAALPACPEPRRGSPQGRGHSQRYENRLSNPFMHFPRRSATPAMGLAAPSSLQTRASSHQTLIANARLKFNASHSKENLLIISNRERIAIFHPRFCTLALKRRLAATRPSKLHSSSQPRAFGRQILIANLELEFRLTRRKLSPLEISNRKYFAIFHLAPATNLPVATEGVRHQEPRRAASSAAPLGLPRPVHASQPRPAE
jgi:hypothetical protein